MLNAYRNRNATKWGQENTQDVTARYNRAAKGLRVGGGEGRAAANQSSDVQDEIYANDIDAAENAIHALMSNTTLHAPTSADQERHQ